MAIVISDGQTVSSDGPWSMPLEWRSGRGNSDHPLLSFFRQVGYDQMFRRQPSVRKVVGKLATLQMMVPLKTYRSAPTGRVDAGDSAYGRLLSSPSPKMSGFDFWSWKAHMYNLHGEAISVKVRDSGGRPVELLPIHPLRIRHGEERGKAWKVADRSRLTDEERDTGNFWWFQLSASEEFQIARRDLVVWREFNPESTHRGLARLEALRASLEDDAAARAAMEMIWKRGARPSYVIKSTDDFSNHPATIQQIQDQAQAAHGGVANWQKPLVLDDGLDVSELRMEKNLEYLELRKVTDAEVAAVFDLTGPAVHILDRATFNNVEELLRDVFRSTMMPKLRSLESTLDFDLRDGRHGASGEPDFGSDFFAEHVTAGVLRGSPEKQIESYSTQIQTGQRTINEIRKLDNLPPIEGGDQLLINGALTSVAGLVEPLGDNPKALAEMVQKLYLGTPERAVISTDEARAVLNRAGAGLTGSPELGPPALSSPSNGLDGGAASMLMGRLSRPESLADVDVEKLTEGLDAAATAAVEAAYDAAVLAGGSVPDLRAAIKEMRTL